MRLLGKEYNKRCTLSPLLFVGEIGVRATILKQLSNCLFATCFLLLTLSSSAQQNSAAKDNKELVALFTQFKKADGYTFHTKIESTIVGDTTKPAIQSTLNYSSLSAFIVYSKTNEGVFFLYSKGQFKVEYAQKIVYYKMFDNDSVRSRMKQYYRVQMANALDSMFLVNATIAQKKINKKGSTYRLSYPKNVMMKEFNIFSKRYSALPESIRYTIERPLNPNNATIQIRQTLTMDHYQHTMPDEVRSLISDTRDLYLYLQQKYAGYTFKKIKN